MRFHLPFSHTHTQHTHTHTMSSSYVLGKPIATLPLCIQVLQACSPASRRFIGTSTRDLIGVNERAWRTLRPLAKSSLALGCLPCVIHPILLIPVLVVPGVPLLLRVAQQLGQLGVVRGVQLGQQPASTLGHPAMLFRVAHVGACSLESPPLGAVHHRGWQTQEVHHLQRAKAKRGRRASEREKGSAKREVGGVMNGEETERGAP